MKKPLKYVDYITKDYEGFRKLMIDLIPSKTPEWTDTSQSDFGIVILELLAHGLDVLSYYQDKEFNEAFLPTARTRRAVIYHCRGLGYELAPQIPARYKLTFTKSSEYLDQEITITKGTKIGTDPNLGVPIVFELDDDLVIPAGTQVGYQTVTHGETIQRDILGVGDDTENQKFKLSNPDVLVDTLTVTTYLSVGDNSSVEVGTSQWTRVKDFLSSTPEDRHYMVEIDEFNNTYLLFGNGRSGMKVPSGYNVQCSYRIGGGYIGNVGLNTINTLLNIDIAGIASITNAEQAIQAGVDSEDIEHARISAPKIYRTQQRAITAQDFEDIASTFKGVSKAKCVETFNPQNEVYIYVAPEGYSPLTNQLKNDLLAYLNEVKLIHVNPVIFDATYLEYDIDVSVTAYSNFVNSQVKGAVEAILLESFAPEYMEFDEDILIANIYKTVLSVEGVKNLVINTPNADIQTHDSVNNIPRLPKLRNVTVTVTGGVDK